MGWLGLRGAHDVKVAMESRRSPAAPARSRVARRKVASYTLSRFLRSQSPPFSHSSAAAFRPAFTACQSPAAMSSLCRICEQLLCNSAQEEHISAGQGMTLQASLCDLVATQCLLYLQGYFVLMTMHRIQTLLSRC